ncbi:uncharacterized protein LOC120334504 isoform X2 [Styela clava]
MEQDAAIKEIGNGDKISLKLPGQDETISDNLNEQSQVNNSDLTKFIKSEKKVQDTLKTSSQVSATCESNGADERHEKILSDRVESLASDISVSNVNSTEEQVLGLKLPVQIEDKPEHRLADVQEMTSVIVTKPSTSSSISLNRELQESGRKVEEIDIQLHCKLDDAKKKVSVYETNSSSFINTKKDQTVGIDSKIIFRDRRLAKVNGNPFQNFPKIYGDYRIKPKVTLLPKVTGTLPIPIRRCEVKFDNKLKTLSRQIPFFGDKRVKFQESNSDDDGEEYFAINEDVDSDDSDTQNNDRKKEKLDEPMEKNHHDDAESCISNGKEENLSLQLKGFCIEGTKFAPKLPPKEEEIMEEIDAGCDEDAIEPSGVKTNRRLKTARRRPMEDDKLFSNRKVNSSAINTLLDKEIVLGGKKTNQKQDAPIQSATANKSCPPDNKKKGAGKPTKQPNDSTGESTSGKKPMVKFDNELKTLSRQIPFFGDKRVKFQESNSDEEGEEYFAINEDVDSDDSDTQNNKRKMEKFDGSMKENHHDDAGSPISNEKEENLSLQLKGFCIEGTKVAPKLPPKVEEIMEEIVAGCDEDVIEPSRVKTNRRIKTARRRPMGCDEDVIEPSRVKTNRRLKTARRRPMGCDEDVIEPSRVKTNRRLKTARRRPMGDFNNKLQVLSREIPHYGGFGKYSNYGIELDENKKDDEDKESIEDFIINGESDSSIRKESENKYCENISSNELLEEIEEKIDKGDNKLSSNQKVNSSAIKSLLNRKQKGGKKKNQKQIAPMPSATANKPCPPDNKKKGAEKSTKQPKGSTGKSSGKKPKGTAKSGNLDDTSKKKTTEQPNLAPKKRKGKFKGVLKALSRIIPHQDHSEDKPNAKIRNLLQGNGKINKKCGTKQQNSNQEMEKNSSYDGMNAVKQEGIVPFVSAGEMQFYDRRIPVENDKMAKMDRKDDKDSSSGDESIIFLTEPPSKKVSRAKKFFRRIGRF